MQDKEMVLKAIRSLMANMNMGDREKLDDEMDSAAGIDESDEADGDDMPQGKMSLADMMRKGGMPEDESDDDMEEEDPEENPLAKKKGMRMAIAEVSTKPMMKAKMKGKY